MESVDKFTNIFMYDRVNRHIARPVLQLRFGRQLAIENQVRGLEVRALFGNLLDPDSEIRFVLKHKKVFRMKEELGTEPKFWFFID